MAAAEESDVESDDRVRCARCRSVVTRAALATSSERTFRNPAGYSWTVRCFSDAGGCSSAGELTAEATWFPGFEWCFAECAACGRHLGWWFVGSGPPFVALIVSRIA